MSYFVDFCRRINYKETLVEKVKLDVQFEKQISNLFQSILEDMALEHKKEWEEEYPEAIITIEPSKDVEGGLINYCTKNNIDVLGVVHRELSSFERLFTINHSQRLLSSANVALLVFQESK